MMMMMMMIIILGLSHKIRKILQPENCNMSGEGHRWFKEGKYQEEKT